MHMPLGENKEKVMHHQAMNALQDLQARVTTGSQRVGLVYKCVIWSIQCLF